MSELLKREKRTKGKGIPHIPSGYSTKLVHYNLQHTTSLCSILLSPFSFFFCKFCTKLYTSPYRIWTIQKTPCVPLTQVKSQFQLCEMRRKGALILSCRSADDGDVDDYPCKLSTLPYPSISHFMKTHPIFFFVGMRVCMCLCDGLVFSCETFSCSSPLEWMMMVETGSPTVSSWNTLLHPAAGEKWLGRVCYGYRYTYSKLD